MRSQSVPLELYRPEALERQRQVGGPVTLSIAGGVFENVVGYVVYSEPWAQFVLEVCSTFGDTLGAGVLLPGAPR
jgi:hypothetical protein